jgi:hypothetical protein
MDIFEQVEKIIKNMETRERKSQNGRLRDEALILEKMVEQYTMYIERGQWNKAHDCLERISRLVVAILAE